MRGLTRMRHPYSDRTCTNERVLDTAARALDPDGRVRIRRLSEYYMAQRKSRQVTFFEGTGEPKFARKKRIGRPRLHWTLECYTAAKAEVLGDRTPYARGQCATAGRAASGFEPMFVRGRRGGGVAGSRRAANVAPAPPSGGGVSAVRPMRRSLGVVPSRPRRVWAGKKGGATCRWAADACQPCTCRGSLGGWRLRLRGLVHRLVVSCAFLSLPLYLVTCGDPGSMARGSPFDLRNACQDSALWRRDEPTPFCGKVDSP